ncbi:heme NO-binding domain-containing protein [Pararhodobacter sp. CCB-MM2]|uniref:heme NO-binding domain-containing protein n=1 Tax=Pararhodobacter sp. CCB-MM2 TaxID=1786003 RepID=UPI0008350C62|nr:heme NO-binding domain-containing protein [Pararhodobacter sp. CCB-MM2]MCA2012512.1 heme NO-binding domain-containing protein [Cereibacter sphaeroides]
MHGLINKALQSFFSDSFGPAAWRDIALRAGLGRVLDSDGFEAMQNYDDAVTVSMLDAAAVTLRRPKESLLEDLGTYLVSHERMEPLRRLLRFGGVSFTDFLYSLDDLQGRSRLAVADLAVPDLSIREIGPDSFRLMCRGQLPGFGHVLVGVLRALADDYGALAVLEHAGEGVDCCDGNEIPCCESIEIVVHDPAHQDAKRFELAAETF